MGRTGLPTSLEAYNCDEYDYYENEYNYKYMIKIKNRSEPTGLPTPLEAVVDVELNSAGSSTGGPSAGILCFDHVLCFDYHNNHGNNYDHQQGSSLQVFYILIFTVIIVIILIYILMITMIITQTL